MGRRNHFYAPNGRGERERVVLGRALSIYATEWISQRREEALKAAGGGMRCAPDPLSRSIGSKTIAESIDDAAASVEISRFHLYHIL